MIRPSPPVIWAPFGGAIAQLGERLNGIQEVRGSTPLGSTTPLRLRRESVRSVTVAQSPPRTRIVTVANQKGGVGKTTTAVNIATALAALRHEVLVIDLDPQGNASTGLGIERTDRAASSYRLLSIENEPIPAPRPTAIPHLSVLPSEIGLAGAELELVDVPRREFRLRRALAPVRAWGRYRYIFVDCPPSLGLLTLNALVAADSVLVPLQCEFFALEGVSSLTRTIETVRQRFNDGLRLQGILLTMFDGRSNNANLVAKDVRDFFGDWVYGTAIPRNVRVAEAPSHGKPVLAYDLRSTGAQAYIAAAQEFLARERRAGAPA